MSSHSGCSQNGNPQTRIRRSQSLQIPDSASSHQQGRTYSESPPARNGHGALPNALHDVASAPSTAPRIVIGAKYGINDLPPSANRLKFDRLKNRFGSKMKESLAKVQQNVVQHQVQRQRTLTALSMQPQEREIKLNELNARNAIKESERVLSLKTKQQLNVQCEELQGLANELSSTIEQKEVILDSLRFANTYLGKRVIALEKLMEMPAGQEITNQDELIRMAIHSEVPEDDGHGDREEKGNVLRESGDDDTKREQSGNETVNGNDIEKERNESAVIKEEDVIITERRESVADIVQRFESPSPEQRGPSESVGAEERNVGDVVFIKEERAHKSEDEQTNGHMDRGNEVQDIGNGHGDDAENTKTELQDE